MKYAHLEEKTNKILGWYDDEIHQNIPTPNIGITDETWQEAININANCYSRNKFITKDFRTQKETDNQEAAELVSKNKISKQLELSSIKVTTTNGNIFDGNELARNNMMSAILSADTVQITEAEWKLADNTIKTISLDELKEALALAIQEVGNIVRKY